MTSCCRGSRFVMFTYMLEAFELEEVQLLLRRLEADLHQVQQLLQVGTYYYYNPRSVAGCCRGSKFIEFGYMLEASEFEEVQLLLRLLEADLHKVQQLLEVGAYYNYYCC